MQQWWKKQKRAIAHIIMEYLMDIGGIGSALTAMQAIARTAATIRSTVSDFYSHR